MSKGINPKEAKKCRNQTGEADFMSRLRKPQRISKRSWKTFQMKKRKTSLTENRTYVRGEFWETELLHPKLSPLPPGTWRTGKRQGKRRKFAVAANSTTLRPETRRQEGATCSGTTGRGTLQRLKTLGLKCQEAPVPTTKEKPRPKCGLV